MKLNKVVVALVAGLIFSVNLVAQKDFKNEADIAFNRGMYFLANELYTKAYAKEKKPAVKAEILFKRGECYRLTENPKDAEVWYDKAIKAKCDIPEVYLYLAHSQKLNGKYAEAKDNYQAFLERKNGDPRGKAGIESCEKALEWKENPTRHVVTPMPLLNSEQYDFSPVFADKRNDQIYFTSTREGSTGSTTHEGTGQAFADIYTSKRDKTGKWSEPTLLNEAVNSEAEEGSSCLNTRKNLMYFTRCGYDSKKGHYGCQIYEAKKQGQNYAEPTLVVIPNANDTNTVGHPAISNDDNTIVFASDMTGTGHQGGKDLWYITYDKKAKSWSEPVNLGPGINTPGDEMFPYIHDVTGDLYFASNGHIGMGGLDIFKSKNKGTNQWENPENLKSPINSEANDFGIIYDGEEDKGFFTSNREGGKGGDDIWEFYMPPVLFALEGVVKDLETQKVIEGAKVSLVGTDGSTYEVTTDVNGYFNFEENGNERIIKANTSYALVVSKDKYLNAKGKESTVGYEDSKIFAHEYELQPITEKPIELPEILYEYNKADLLPQSKDSLNFLYQVLIDNPNLTIALYSNTDFRGGDAYNQKLSQRRAQACVDYLVKEKGIPADRIKAVGNGERVPRELKRDMMGFKKGTVLSETYIKGLKDKKQIEDAHQLNRRTEFSVTGTDYVPKAN